MTWPAWTVTRGEGVIIGVGDDEIVRPSRSRRLDQQAVAIVRAASPFGPFTPAMRAQADQIVVTSRFRFTREDGLETSLSSR